MNRTTLVAILLLAGCPKRGPSTDPELTATLTERLGPDVFAIGSLVRDANGVRSAVVGTRFVGSDEPARIEDAWHLGSDTKAMTATLVSRLEAEGVIRWEQTLAESFPDVAVHASWSDISLWDLATHRSGMTRSLPLELGTAWLALISRTDDTQARSELVRTLLEGPRPQPSGEYSYSNAGYITLGAALEQATGTPWKELMQTQLFEPLSMEGCGFGPPSAIRGHRGQVPLAPDSLFADNPPVLGPAGTVHCPLPGWAAFAEAHLQGMSDAGHPYLPKASWDALHTPEGTYAGGWGVSPEPLQLAHSGSNTLWFATIVIAPTDDRFVLVTSNSAGEAAMNAVLDLSRELMKTATP